MIASVYEGWESLTVGAADGDSNLYGCETGNKRALETDFLYRKLLTYF